MNNKKFIEKIEQFNIIIQHSGEDILVSRENLKSYDMMTEILEMQKTELALEIENLKKIEKEKKKSLSKIIQTSENSNNHFNVALYNLKNNLDENYLIELKNLRKNELEDRNNEIKKYVEEVTEEFWEILEPILKKIGVSKNYVYKDVIFRKKLAGISGTQRHKLALAYKIALNLFVEKK